MLDGDAVAPQVEGAVAEPAAQPGPVQDQAPATPAAPVSEATAKPAAETVPAEQYRRLQAQKDQEIAARDRYMQQAAMQQQIAQMQAQEAAAQAADRAAVEAGDITDQTAGQRQQLRHAYARQHMEYQRLASVTGALAQRGEELGYVLAAHDIAQELGKEEGLAEAETQKLLQDLMAGDRAATPSAMRAKAERIMRLRVKTKARPAEVFDRGGASPPDTPGAEADRLKTRYPTMFPK